MDIGKGFLQLQEENSRRSSLRPISLGTNSAAYTTRLGCCGLWNLKVERDDGSVRIGRLSLAPHCHLALMVFGVCFLLAGIVLTGLAYSRNNSHQADAQQTPLTSEKPVPVYQKESYEEKVAGPLFVVIGCVLVTVGVGLALLGCKLERAAASQRSALTRFSIDARSGDIFANLGETQSQGGDSYRRGSFFGPSFNPTRRSTLSTIAQAVPVGFFLSDSPRTPKSPNEAGAGTGPRPSVATTSTTAEDFQDVELGSPGGKEDDEFHLPALALRPSIIPIPMFSSHMLHDHAMMIPSRSDEPFGSIASLGGGTGNIASFPVPRPKLSLQEAVESGGNRSTGLPPISVPDIPFQLARPPLRTRSQDDGDESALQAPSEAQQKRPSSGT